MKITALTQAIARPVITPINRCQVIQHNRREGKTLVVIASAARQPSSRKSVKSCYHHLWPLWIAASQAPRNDERLLQIDAINQGGGGPSAGTLSDFSGSSAGSGFLGGSFSLIGSRASASSMFFHCQSSIAGFAAAFSS